MGLWRSPEDRLFMCEDARAIRARRQLSGFVFDPVCHCVDTEMMVRRTMRAFRDTGFMFGSFSVNVRLLARGQSSNSFEVNLAFVKETMPAVSVYLDI